MAEAPRTGRRWNVPVLILGAILAVGGFVASLLIGASHTTGSPTTNTSPVVVAARDLEARTTIATGDLTVVRYSNADVPPAVVTSIAPAVGMVLQVALKRNQPLLSNLLGKTGDVATTTGGQPGFLPLDKGLVATTLPTGELVGVADFIRSGDYIDVVAIVTPKGATTANVRTIYAGIHVIRTGLAGQQGSGQGAGSATSSLTIAVTQCQAEYLDWFISNATLKYTLLSSQDYPSAGAAPDNACPASGSKGVVDSDIKARWPGLAG